MIVTKEVDKIGKLISLSKHLCSLVSKLNAEATTYSRGYGRRGEIKSEAVFNTDNISEAITCSKALFFFNAKANINDFVLCKGFRKRWFTLDGQYLTYYKAPEKTVWNNVIAD